MQKFQVILLFIFLFLTSVTFSQTGLNFQGVARNSNNVILASQQVSLRLSILQGSATGNAEYSETRTVTTNAQGLFAVVIGDASATNAIGNFNNINWKNTPKYLKIEMDPLAGTNFVSMGTTQFQYVAYAQFANGVDAANIAGIIPVSKGGTGVASLAELKNTLKVPNLDSAVFLHDITIRGLKLGTGTGIDSSNILMAKHSFIRNDSGTDNIAIGDSVLMSNINGSNNIGIGKFILTSNTTGSKNISLGFNSFNTNTTGSSNVAIGNYANYTNTTGSSNVAIGNYAFKVNTTGSSNVAIGPFAMYSNTTGESNIAIGPSAMYKNTTGIRNLSIGLYSLSNNDVGTDNIGIGTSTLNSNTSGLNNIAIGSNALKKNTTAIRNISIGLNSMANNNPGNDNIAIGNEALLSNSAANYNIAIGYTSLRSNTTGQNNAAIGRSSLYNNTTGNNNVAFGTYTLNSNIIGSNNTAFGYQSLKGSKGDNNTGIGSNALYYNTTGNYNTAIGESAGFTNIYGSNNVFIGNLADANADNLNNAIAIGDGAVVNASNSIQLGNSSITSVNTNGTITANGFSVPSGTSSQFLKADGTLDANTYVNSADNQIKIGAGTGIVGQGLYSIAMGNYAANSNQGNNAIAVGNNAGNQSQGNNTVGIGGYAANANQATNAISIGYAAGFTNQGASSIAIGAYAGMTNQANNSIILNASGSVINTTSTGLYVKPIRSGANSSNVLVYDDITNEISYNNAKTFVIPHPTKEDSYLVHAALEGPEAGVYYRGEGKIVNNKFVKISLPDYVSAFANNFSIQITPIYNNDSDENIIFSTSRVRENAFTVHGKNGSFYWIVYAQRGKVEVEPKKSEVELKGDGPYKYLQNKNHIKN